MDNHSLPAFVSAPLDFLLTFTQAMHTASNPGQIGQTAVALLGQKFQTYSLTLYQ